MENYLLISDAAKRVQVESHVLRYWEEELKLPIKRNESGHRYYTQKDIEQFLRIKSMKERGLQLKAIKMILKGDNLDVMPLENLDTEWEEEQELQPKEKHMISLEPTMAIDIIRKEEVVPAAEPTKDERAQRLQLLLKQLILDTLQENNQTLCKDIRESVVKELDYQFRCREERETQRDMERDKRNEEYYQKMDNLLRRKSGRIKKAVNECEKQEERMSLEEKSPIHNKKKRHLFS